eukprot:185102-Rhodomonas_salina.2
MKRARHCQLLLSSQVPVQGKTTRSVCFQMSFEIVQGHAHSPQCLLLLHLHCECSSLRLNFLHLQL